MRRWVEPGKLLQAEAPGPTCPHLCPPPQVFKKAFIPRTLTEVSTYERDVDLMKEQSDAVGHAHSVSTQNLLDLLIVMWTAET